jgi:hypothetical protein
MDNLGYIHIRVKIFRTYVYCKRLVFHSFGLFPGMIVSHNATSSLAMTIITYIYIGTSFTEESPNVEIQNVGKVLENVVFI